MKFVRETSPFIRKNVSVKRMMLNVLIALIPVALFAMIQNGWNGVYVILASVLTMLIIEFIAVALIKWPDGMKRRDLFTKEGFKKVVAGFNANNIICPIISAVIYSMLLPAATPVYVVIVGSVVGILFGKLVFGPYGNNIFNPAAVGFIFVKLAFGSQLDAAMNSQAAIVFPGLIQNDVIAGGTPLTQIAGNLGNFAQAIGTYSLTDLLIGNVPGAMGEVCSILIVVSFVYLVATRTIDLRASLSMMLSFIVVTFFVGVVLHGKNGTDIMQFTAYQFLAGGLLFAAVFMITDPVTSPTTKFGRVAFGTFAGLMVALIRYLGAYPEGTAFAILLANMIAPAIDYFMRGKKNGYTWVQAVGVVVAVAVVCLVVALTVNGKVDAVETATNFVALGGF